MSIRAVVWAFEQKLPCSQKFVLVALADAADLDGLCWPSQNSIAKKCGLSRQHVNNVIAELELKGFLSYNQRRREDGADSSCEYRLSIPEEARAFPNEKDAAGFVYLVASADALKIGITRDLKRRLDGMQGQSGESISIVKSWPMQMRLARTIERSAHENFTDARRHGEWFDITAEQAISYIDGVVSTATTPLSTATTPGVNGEDAPCQQGRHQEPLREPSREFPPLISPPRMSAKQEFEAWWQEYPRKVGKDAAARKYLVARKSATAETLLAAVKRYAANAPPEKQYIAHPSTWLHHGRWKDEDVSGAPEERDTGPPGPPPKPEELWPELRVG